MGARECLRNGPSGLPSSEGHGTSRQIARTNSSFPQLTFGVLFSSASGTCHPLYLEYNSLFALALSVEQLYCESSFYFSHADQLGIFITCSRIPISTHCNKLSMIAHPPKAPTTTASKTPLPSHVSAKYAPIPTATSFVLAASLCSIHSGFSPKGGTSRTSSLFAPSPSASSSSPVLGSGMASAGTEKEQATGRWSLEAMTGSAV